jgi:predicted enzyme related to lactoylglutathione lyase
MPHKHCITHIEIPAEDTAAAGRFYQNVFEWNLKEFPEMDYTTFEAEGGTGGGFTKVDDTTPIGSVLLYINTPNLKESLEKVKANGGSVLLESYVIPTVGTMATFKDPAGNTIALLEPEMRE